MKFSKHIKIVSTLSLALTGAAFAVPQELVDDLGDENYQLREKAEKELVQWAKKEGRKGVEELDQLKKKAQSPEVKSRLDNVISGVTVYKAIPGTRGFMGISMQPLMGAAVIMTVSPKTPAQKAGLQPNDKIIELDGIDLSKKNKHADEAMDFLRTYVKSKKAGEKLTLKLDRGGKKLTKELKLADYDKMMRLQDPFGNGFNNGGIQILPMQGGGIQGNIQILPRRKNLNPKELKLNEKERIELNLRHQKQLLDQAELPDEIKDILRQQNERQEKRLEQLKKELNLDMKAAPKK